MENEFTLGLNFGNLSRKTIDCCLPAKDHTFKTAAKQYPQQYTRTAFIGECCPLFQFLAMRSYTYNQILCFFISGDVPDVTNIGYGLVNSSRTGTSQHCKIGSFRFYSLKSLKNYFHAKGFQPTQKSLSANIKP